MVKKYVEKFNFKDTDTEVYVRDAEAQEEVESITGEVASLEADLKKLNNTTNENSKNLSLLKNRKFVLIGDSYAGYNPNWMDTLISVLGLTDTQKSNAGGASFSNTENSFTMLLNKCTDDNEITDIIVGGGYNDITWSETQHRDGMTSFATLAKQKFPNAKVHLANFGWTTNATYYTQRVQSLKYYKQIGNELGFDYYDGCEYILHSYEDMRSDGYHPSNSANIRIGNYLANCVRNGSCSPIHSSSLTTINPSEGWTIGSSQSIYSTIANGILEVISNDFSCTHAPFTLNCDGRLIEIGSYNRGLLVGQPNNFMIHQLTGLVLRNEGGYMTLPINLHFCNGKLSFSCYYVDSSNAGAYYTIDIKGLQLPKFKFECSAIYN